MAEHLYAHLFAFRSAYVLFLYLAVYLSHLVHVEFACQDNHVGELGVELQRLYIAYVELCGEVHLHAFLVAVGHHGHVAGYHCGDVRLVCGVDYLVHCVDVLAVDYRVHREITLYAVLGTGGGNLVQVVDGEVVCRVRSHVELFHAEINRVGSGLYGSRQTFA